MTTRTPDYFVHAQRNKTVVNIPVYNVPELTDPETAAKYGNECKTTKQSAFAIRDGFLKDQWVNVYVVNGETMKRVIR